MNRIKREIEALFPDLKIGSIRHLGTGWTCTAYLVNENIVFKIPKDGSFDASIEKEKTALKSLYKKTTLAIPEILYVGVLQNGSPIIGETRIKGKLLTEKIFRNMGSGQRKEILKDLGNLIHEIHQVKPDLKSGMFYTQNLKENMDYAYGHYTDFIRSVLTSAGNKGVTDLFNAYEAVNKIPFAAVFSHGDLHLENVYFDPQTSKLAGVIDFGGMCFADPYYDLRYFWNLGIKEAAEAARLPLDHEAKVRILFFQVCNAFDTILTYCKNGKNFEGELHDLNAMIEVFYRC